MASEVKTITHKIDITEVLDVQITEIVAADGLFTRAVRIYGAPHGTDGPPVIELVINSEDRADIEITTPEVNF